MKLKHQEEYDQFLNKCMLQVRKQIKYIENQLLIADTFEDKIKNAFNIIKLKMDFDRFCYKYRGYYNYGSRNAVALELKHTMAKYWD